MTVEPYLVVDNWRSVLKSLRKERYRDSEIFKAFEQVSENTAAIIHSDLAELMLSQIPAVISRGDDKPTAASKGNAHRGEASEGMLFVYPAGRQHPEVVSCNHAGFYAAFDLSTSLLIIENMHLFFHVNQVSRFLVQQCTDVPAFSKMDIAFGGGNAITASYLRDYLTSYQAVYCLFDIDLGGIKIFNTLNQNLSGEVRFVVPQNLKEFLADSRRFLSGSARAHLLNLRWLCGNAEIARQLILSTDKTLEQEVYLG